jgi:hypothetical protein
MIWMRRVRGLLIPVVVLATLGWLLGPTTRRDAGDPPAPAQDPVPAPRAPPARTPAPRRPPPPSRQTDPASRAAAPRRPPPPGALKGRPVSVTVSTRSPAPAVPKEFLGLSFEMSDLPRIARYADRGNLVTFLRALGPGVMRFGGTSADTQAAWSPDGVAKPRWAKVAISPRSLDGIGRLAREAGWRVLLTLPLGHPDARAAAAEAAAARTALGDRLAGLEIGNEPDIFVEQRLHASPWRFSDYRVHLASYRRALARAVPGVPLAGPDASSGQVPLAWVRAEARVVRPGLLTVHYYPETRCGERPRLGALLSRAVRDAETAMLTDLAAISHRAGIPVRVGETNNISCGGLPGVSNAFASALWAVDYVPRVMRAGLAGINVHDLIARPHSYAPLAVSDRRSLVRGELRAKPEWYALLLTRLLRGDRPVHAQVRAGGRALTASALRAPGRRLHLVLTDFESAGAGPVRVRLHVSRRYVTGTILRLTGPSAGALTGVSLGGAAVEASGEWSPRLPLPRVSGGRGTLTVSMPPGSAALVTLSPQR